MDVNRLRDEMAHRDEQWVTAFEGHVNHVDARNERIEGAMRTVDTSFQPLGKKYDTRLGRVK